MHENDLPHEKIVFVCINQRPKGERVCCTSKNGPELHAKLKEIVRERGYRTKIRISKSGCMDRFEEGANIMIMPDNRWLSDVQDEDLEPLVDSLIADIERDTN